MSTLEFIHHLRTRGIQVWLDGGALRFRAVETAMTPELRQELKSRKSELVTFLRQVTQDPRLDVPPLRRAPRHGHLPLSFAQQRLWFVDQLDPGLPLYSIHDGTDIGQPLNVGALRRALTEVVRRHEILRTTFRNVDGVPVQVIAPPAPFPLPLIDLTGLTEGERGRAAKRLEVEEERLAFNLAEGPLLRVKLVKMADAHYRWLLNIHHIITDDWSKKLFDQEVDTLYTAFCRGLPSPLPELPIQFADFALWQREWFQGKVLESHAGYWVERLAGDLPTLDLPTDRQRRHSFKGTTGLFRFSRAASRAVKRLSERESVTQFMVLVAAYAALLSRYTRQDDIIIGSPISDRNQVETEQLIGFLLNTLILRIQLTGDPTFGDLLKHVREVCLGAQMHQEVPYEIVLPRLRVSRDLSGNPLFQTMLGLLNTPSITKSSHGFWGSQDGGIWPDHGGDAAPDDEGGYWRHENNGTTKFDLSITIVEENHDYRGTTEYNTDLFDHETIAALIERLQLLLRSAAENPEQRISELSLMTGAQRRQVLGEWGGQDVDFAGGQCAHELFEAQVARTPQAIAVEFDGQRVTYADLNARANQLARVIRNAGGGCDVMVGIFLERSVELVIAILATLKAGAAYVPLDPIYPQQRLATILEDARVKVMVTEQRLLERLPSLPALICLDTQGEEIAAQDVDNLPCETSPHAVVCVLYTSGSTGRPKGVMLTHEGLVNYTISAIRQYRVVEGDRMLQFSSMAFDAILEEMYTVLSRGGTLVVRTDEMLGSVGTFLSRCAEWGITLIVLPSAYWHEIVARVDVEAMPPGLRLLVIGGERALPEKLAMWQKAVGDRIVLVNTYGPTEGTIAVTRCVLPADAVEESALCEVPIGWPIENSRVYVLDPRMQPVPAGMPGELYLGGAALARGYLNQPDLTADKFVPDPFSEKPGARLYKTGDLVRHRAAGNLEYMGRTDQQVKIRGYRIEPAEIESALEKHEDVRHAAVLAREDEPGLKQLVAYVVAKEGSELSTADLRGFLKQRVPEYMLPAFFVFLEKLPLNSSGKIDRPALPKPDRSRAAVAEALAAPRTPAEEAVAAIWSTILKLDRIGIHEDFFELGGHSLLATQVTSRISDKFHIEMPLRRLFELPTIAELAAAVDQLVQTGSNNGTTTEATHRIRSVRDLANDQDAFGNPSVDQMLAGLAGLSEQEVEALLGEADDTR